MGRFLETASAASKARTSAGAVTAKTNSQTLVADTEGQRVGLYVTNEGANDVWLALGEKAEPQKGIYVKKEGGAATIDNYTGVVSVVTKTGESNVTFAEL
ncbi:MAG TPA: hypothetical protein VF009_06950 [Solirubrobacterales bacterium]